jgi:MFS family permease
MADMMNSEAEKGGITFSNRPYHPPSPEVDPSDTSNPQNWSPWRKRLVFVALMSSSILCDGGMTWGATLIVPQAMQWKISINKSATSLNYGILLQGVGGILAVPFMDAFGRLPVWFYPQLITLFVVLGCCFAQDYSSFTALRALQGLFGTIPQVIGLPIIHDMYATRDWPWYINIWGTTFLVGPFLGPALAGYLFEATSSWRAVFGILTGLYAISTLMVLAFARETYFNHQTHYHQNSRVHSFLAVRNTDLPKISTFTASIARINKLIITPPILLTGIATLILFTWPIGITTTIDPVLHAPPYLMNNITAASMRFAGVIGALLGFLLGHIFNHYIRRRANTRDLTWCPEIRLHGVWLPIICMAGGLLLYGLILNYAASWIGLAFGWILVNIGLIASTVAVSSFALEKYPEHASVVAAILNLWRTGGGFSVAYFQPEWVAKNGAAVVYVIQAVIVVVGAGALLGATVYLGRREAKRKEVRGSLESS